jgi:beta-galactosidase GanA
VSGERPLPTLRSTATGSQLIVDGRPALLLGGQLHNSSPSSPEYMQPIWDRLADAGIRTVIGAASWAQVEPVEGTFDFSTVDAQIEQARARGMRLVLIWFGAFKNAASTYAPVWVRRDTSRFPRAVAAGTDTALFTYPGAMPKPVLTVFAPNLLDADRRAFVRFMEHVADVDPDHTVVMVQVENEVGLLRDSRDRSPEAEAAWRSAVPEALFDHLVASQSELRPELAALWARQGNRKSGTWAEVFGEDWQADEVFMAWGFASYCGALAAAAKAVKPLPMYANAWLGPQPGQPHAGDYPSGGPVGRVIDVWKAAAPSLDLVAPDIYVDDAKPVLRDYDRPDNPVFVPESRFAIGRMFWALGHHRALGFSVFGVDHARPDGQLGRACALLGEMEDVITAAQAEGRIAGVLLDDGESEQRFTLGGYAVVARNSRALLGQMLLDAGVGEPPPPPPAPSETDGSPHGPSPADARPFALVIAEAEDQFLLVGQGVGLDFSRGADLVEVDSVEEGRFESGRWVPGRALNGDERLFLLPLDGLGAVRIRLLPLPSPTAKDSA